MDIKNDLTYRTHYYKKHEINGSNKYKYDEDGILIRCVPKILFNGNSFFVTFLLIILEVLTDIKIPFLKGGTFDIYPALTKNLCLSKTK